MQAEDDSQSHLTHQPVRRWGWTVLTYGLGAACLYWVFHDISFSELVRSLAKTHGWWVLPAAVFELLVYEIGRAHV